MAQPGQQTENATRRRGKRLWLAILIFGLVATVALFACQLVHHFNPTRMPQDCSPVLDWTAYVVGLAGLIIAIKTDSGVSETLGGMNMALVGINKAHVGIELWARAMMTRHIGTFPEHLEKICELVNATIANGTLDIMADCADYGSFYDPERYRGLQAAIVTAHSKGVKIRYVACGRLHRFTANSPYFGKEISGLSPSEQSDFAERLRHFLDLVGKDQSFLGKLRECADDHVHLDLLVKWLKDNTSPQPTEIDWATECKNLIQIFLAEAPPTAARFESERMLDLLLFVREWFNETMLRSVTDFKRDPRMAPLFIWVRDASTDPEAVFVLPSPVTRGFGFRTLDFILISSFSKTFEQYCPPR
jgi:hypothetical protein